VDPEGGSLLLAFLGVLKKKSNMKNLERSMKASQTSLQLAKTGKPY
jgi:hypothetical protein